MRRARTRSWRRAGHGRRTPTCRPPGRRSVGVSRRRLLTSSVPLKVQGLALQQEGLTRILIANLTNERQRVAPSSGFKAARIKALDETNALNAMIAPERFQTMKRSASSCVKNVAEMEMAPYALADIETTHSRLRLLVFAVIDDLLRLVRIFRL